MEIFNFQDMTSAFMVIDVVLVFVLSFVLSAFIGWIYKITHRGSSYTQSFVFTLVLNGMVVALVMMIVGSNIARAFSLVGALSIIRYRNAVKETRDVGFIFFTMAIGMAVGTQFYTLAVIGAVVISLLILLMVRFNWFAQEMANQILRIQVPGDVSFEELFESAFLKYTSTADLIAVDSIQSGTLTEVTYNIGLKKPSSVDKFLAAIKKLNNNNKVTLVTGYHGTDL